MIYVDSCIPMYLVGAEHPLKSKVIQKLHVLVNSKEDLVTSVEAFQEIIHRYLSIKDIQTLNFAYEALEHIVSIVLPISKEDSDLAKTFASFGGKLSSRDCIHLAVMKSHNCKKIWTYDRGFQQVQSIKIVN
jgi:uncharacterized protein